MEHEKPSSVTDGRPLAPEECLPVPDVLLVDDDADHALLFDSFLSAAGHRVRSAASADAALALTAAYRFDAKVLNLRLPGADGVELCRQLRLLRPATADLPILAFSAEVNAARIHALDLVLERFDQPGPQRQRGRLPQQAGPPRRSYRRCADAAAEMPQQHCSAACSRGYVGSTCGNTSRRWPGFAESGWLSPPAVGQAIA